MMASNEPLHNTDELTPLIRPNGDFSSLNSSYSSTDSVPFTSNARPLLNGETTGIQSSPLDPYANGDNSVLTGGLTSVQSSTTHTQNSAMVVGSTPVGHVTGPGRLPVTGLGRQQEGRPLGLPNLQFLDPIDTSASGNGLEDRDQSNTPDTGEGRFVQETTLPDTVYNAEKSLPLNHNPLPRRHSPIREGALTRFYQTLKQQASARPCLVAFLICLFLFSGAVLVASIVFPTVQLTQCQDLDIETDVHSGDTVLVGENIGSLCYSLLSAVSGTAKHDQSIVQEIDYYVTDCGNLKTYSKPVEILFRDRTSSLTLVEDEYWTVDSAFTINVNVSVIPGHSSEIVACIYDNAEYFAEFLHFQNHWKDVLEYAIYCNSSTIDASNDNMTIFNFRIKKSQYYYIGIRPDGQLASLDTHMYGDRLLYNKTDYTQVNCSQSSELPCQLPATSSGSIPCVLGYAVTPADERRGYTCVQITSPKTITTTQGITYIGVAAAIGAIALLILFLLVCVPFGCILYMSCK